MNIHNPKHQAGFTLIELMMATIVFSAVLVVILASFLQVGRIYYKGVSVSSTNEATRTLVDDIANDIRITQSIPTHWQGTGNSAGYFCIGQHRYTFKPNQKVTDSDVSANAATFNAGVILDTISGCPAPSSSTLGTSAQQLLGANMQLNNLVLQCNQFNNGGCSINAHVIYYGADNTVFISGLQPADDGTQAAANDPDAECSGNLLSTQFCAVADFKANALAGGI